VNALTNNLQHTLHSLTYVWPELMLAAGAVLCLLVGLVSRNRYDVLYLSLGIAIQIAALIVTNLMKLPEVVVQPFSGSLFISSFTIQMSTLTDVGVLLALLLTFSQQNILQEKRTSEYVALLLSMSLGARLLIGSGNFLMIFLAVEILSITAYLLSGWGTSRRGAEAALKYFLFGSVAAALMVYGFSILYGLQGSADLTYDPSASRLSYPIAFVLVAGLLVLAGILYKMGAAPMHLWAPDVYEAAPLPVVALFSTVPKLAATAILVRFAFMIQSRGHEFFDWQTILAVVAVISMTFGNFSALRQKDPKRMMAYSSIAQSGFLLLGIISFSEEGAQIMEFYAAVYLIMNFAVFYALQSFEQEGISTIADFKGTGPGRVFVSVVLCIALVGLAGIPPTAGFTSKLLVFSFVWDAYELTGKNILLWLLIFGLLNTVISLFYYLKIPFYSFLKAGSTLPTAKSFSWQNFLMLVLVIGILLLFLMPSLLMGWLNRSNFAP
jgi:NADH-quinone oxidoreductase subunit N